MFKNILKKIKQKIIGEYSTDIALRYLPVIDLLKQRALTSLSILEVGSGDFGMTTYLKKKIIGVDIIFSEQSNQWLEKIKINGDHFPFFDQQFDLVLSVDNLEHISSEKRRNFIKEIARVSKQFILIVVPYGQAALQHDFYLNEFFEKTQKCKDKFLSEHLHYGLPVESEIEDYVIEAIKQSGRKVSKINEISLLNIYLRKLFMKCRFSKNIILNSIYYLFLLLIPMRKLLNFGKCYRKLYLFKIE